MRDPFEQLREVFLRMPPEHLKALQTAHRDFSRLKTLCEARGYIEVLPRLTGIKVLKNKPEVRELKKVIDFLKPGNFEWQDIKKQGGKSKRRLGGN